jgi:hypothetical protein
VIVAATEDAAFLCYRQPDDLGGFMPAPVGEIGLSGSGRDFRLRTFATEIPLCADAGGRKIFSFLAGTGQTPATTPDNGALPVPGLGVPAPSPPPTKSSTVPPANQGFGGTPGSGTGGTTTRAKPPATTPEATATTTATPTITTAPTTTSQPPTDTTAASQAGGLPGGSGCGTAGLQVESNPPGCVISLTEGAPGSSVSEVMTITNTSSSIYTLSLQAEGANNNALWNDLEMGVYPEHTPPPSPLPPLSYWTAQFNDLTTLNPGQTIAYVIVLYLPTTAGNRDQGLSASIDFHWRALG